MMSEKKTRKRNVKTGDGEPEICVTEEVEGRVAGTAKMLMDAKVHELLAEEQEVPPPAYSAQGARDKAMTTSFKLTGQI